MTMTKKKNRKILQQPEKGKIEKQPYFQNKGKNCRMNEKAEVRWEYIY